MLLSSLTGSSSSTLSRHHWIYISRIFHCIWIQSMKHYHLKYLYGCNFLVNGLYREYSKYAPQRLKTYFSLKYAHTSKSGTFLTVLYKIGLIWKGEKLNVIHQQSWTGRQEQKTVFPFLEQVKHCHDGKKILVWAEINVCDWTDICVSLNDCCIHL